MTWKPDICVHHFPCDDGFGSAWVVHRKWGDAVEMRPCNYGQPVPDKDIDGKNILIADFSFKPDVLRAMAARAKSIIILDHHKSAKEDLADISAFIGDCAYFDLSEYTTNLVARFEMEKSGAMLTWEFCFGDEKPPRLVGHLQDRDLWKMELAGTREISLYLRSFDFDFSTWTEIARRLDELPNIVLGEAAAIQRFYDRKLAEMVPAAVVGKLGKWDGVPIVNAPWAFASDLGHELLKAHPEAPFAAVYYDSYGARSYSLRSEDNRQDVSEVARTFGGGGHRNAAGFRCP